MIPVAAQQPVYIDTVFDQEKSEFYEAQADLSLSFTKVARDRNGVVQCVANGMLLTTIGSSLLQDHRYRFMDDLTIRDLALYHEQFVYLTDEAVFSNSWAGKHHFYHGMPGAHKFAIDQSFNVLVANNHQLTFFKRGTAESSIDFPSRHKINNILFDASSNLFWLLGSSGLLQFDPTSGLLQEALSGYDIRDIALGLDGFLWLATSKGLMAYDHLDGRVVSTITSLPNTNLTSIELIAGRWWIGSKRGAFNIDVHDLDDIDYYASRRWLPSDHVIDIATGADRQVLVLTTKGLASISFADYTLYDKAIHFEDQVRRRHIRHGFNCAEFIMKRPEDLSSGYMVDSDNDGLWTSMYLASQIFRYAVTKSSAAHQNVVEAFEAMERLNTINPIKGFLSRSFERSSYALHDLSAWHRADDSLWDWKGTTSSDEAIGHYFAFSLIAELMPDQDLKQRAISLILEMTDHIIDHDLYLVDIDGAPTRWARWNPDYVNGFPEGVGDRKLNSSNIIGFLQTAYHFSKDQKYRDEADRLIEDFGYLDNLVKPMEEIGVHTDDALSKMLSSRWNHSDDEMYFLSYWNLYPYAFTNDLKEKYRQAIKNHWNIERPEKDGLWNLCYAMTGAEEFDLNETIWYLQEFPLDLIDYTIQNSHRQDITLLPPNFRDQTTEEVLPPDERPVYKHNTNTFVIDRNRGGLREASGDIYLLPYWMGRYLGVISEPQ